MYQEIHQVSHLDLTPNVPQFFFFKLMILNSNSKFWFPLKILNHHHGHKMQTMNGYVHSVLLLT